MSLDPPTPPSRFLRGRWRVLLLLVPAIVTAAGGLAAILAVEHVRENARHEGTVAAVAEANATQVRQAAVAVSAVGMLLGDARIDDTKSITAGLAKLRANNQAQSAEIERLVGGRADEQEVLREVARARTAGLLLLLPPITTGKLQRSAVSLSSAAAGLSRIAVNARRREHAADRRADAVTVAVLLLGVLAITGSWWGFLVVARRMQRRHVDTLEHLADHDPLTGLGNRRALDAAIRDATGRTTLAVCDLDGFKAFNDQLGHHAGDDLLQRLAARLEDVASRRGGRAFRVGGDEFCVVVAEANPGELRTVCAEALRERGGAVEVGGSVGVAMMPEDGATLDEVWRVADARLYDAKRARYVSDPAADRRAAHERGRQSA